MNRVELLAPSGNFECVKAAVASGANAVYLGGQQFSARAYANNFSIEELDKVCDYCHSYDVKVYVTVNTLYKDGEFEQLLSFVESLYEIGVDGLIMQDLGAISVVRRCFPDLPVHASTQLTANSLDEVKAFEEMGLTTVVLSRELGLDEIRHICRNTSLRIEVFIHGALCVTYSGQCYISSVLGNRSGNRGKCAQNCRLEYNLSSGGKKLSEGHLLSTKDICTIDELRELLDAGVASLKIEGRMKSPEYVALVTSVYRKYIDEYYKGNRLKVTNEDFLALQYSFNRGGFSAGYLKQRSGPEMMCPVHPRNWGVFAGRVVSYDRNKETVAIKFDRDMKNGDGVEIWSDDENGTGFYINKPVTAGQVVTFKVKGHIRKQQAVYQTFNKALNDLVDRNYKNNTRKLDVTAEVRIHRDEEMSMSVSFNGITAEVRGAIPEASLNQPLTAEAARQQLQKTGNTNISITDMKTDVEDGLFVNRADLNALRNKAVERFNRKLTGGRKRKSRVSLLPEVETASHTGDFSVNVLVNDLNQLKAVCAEPFIDTVYLPTKKEFAYQEAIDLIHKYGKKAVLKLPRLWRRHTQNTYAAVIDNVSDMNIDGYLIHNIGQYHRFKNSGRMLCLDYTGNIINSYSMAFWNAVERKAFSIEASTAEINGIADNTSAEVLIYGRLPLMMTEQCPVGNFVGNKKKLFCRKRHDSQKYYLENNGNRFLLERDCDDCICQIVSREPVKRYSLINKVSVPYFRVDFSDESSSEAREVIRLIKNAVENGSDDNKLAGIYYRSID